MKILLLILFLILFIFYIPHSVFASTIKINEFSSASNPEWIELYNTDSNAVNLNGFVVLFDDNITTSQKITFGVTDTISGNGFKVVEHLFSSSGWLNNSGDTIILEDQTGNPLDSVTYGTGLWVPTSNQSGCRSIDGGGLWVICSNPTKGSTNQIALSPTPTPTSTPTPSPTPTPSSAPQATSSFTINNIPSQINSDQSFSVPVNLSLPSNPNTDFYLKGAFKKADSSNYFGLTKVSGNWIKNSGSYSNQFAITTDSSGNWSGNLEIMADTSDSGYSGSGDYIFKVGRYENDGANLTWSNETTIKINNVDTSSSNNSDISSTPDSNSNTESSVTPSPTISKSATPVPAKSPNYSYQIASVAGATTSAKSATGEGAVSAKNQRQINPIVWLGLALIFAGCGSIGYIYFKKNAKIHIPWRR